MRIHFFRCDWDPRVLAHGSAPKIENSGVRPQCGQPATTDRHDFPARAVSPRRPSPQTATAGASPVAPFCRCFMPQPSGPDCRPTSRPARFVARAPPSFYAAGPACTILRRQGYAGRASRNCWATNRSTPSTVAPRSRPSTSRGSTSGAICGKVTEAKGIVRADASNVES